MKILPPKIEKNKEGATCNSFPDDAPTDYIRVDFEDGKYVFYEAVDELPAATGK